MFSTKQVAFSVADILLQIKAIKLDTKNGFTWASGWKSPVYCDNRVLLSYPDRRSFVADQMANQIKEKFEQADTIAAVATGAVGIGAIVAYILKKPLVYVRPEPKKHGRKNQIEGALNSSSKVVVIEDLISTGKSSLAAVDALRRSNIEILGMTAIFSYKFKIAEDSFETQNVPLYCLSDYLHLIERAVASEYIGEKDLNTLEQWRISPQTWNI